VGNHGLLDHLEDIPSYVHVSYYFCTHCSETVEENQFKHCLVNTKQIVLGWNDSLVTMLLVLF
jgi:hypothetical protein